MSEVIIFAWANFIMIRVSDPDPVFLPGSGSCVQITLDSDPDPVPGFKFLWIKGLHVHSFISTMNN